MALGLLSLGGCRTMPVGGDGLTLDARRERLEAVEEWEMRGRLAVDTGERAFQGSFQWHQNRDALELVVRGPLGGGVLQVRGSPGALTVTSGGETWLLEDPEADLSELLGWWLPVASLPAWLVGLPDPAHRAETRTGEIGALESLEQRAWRLDYVSYQLREGLLIPRRIDMSHGPLKVRVAVDAWVPAGAVPAS
ncbi:MAG TPA: lipoprotein insertase outer membrane protein LolB [Gammaproteobacteria bacterium]